MYILPNGTLNTRLVIILTFGTAVEYALLPELHFGTTASENFCQFTLLDVREVIKSLQNIWLSQKYFVNLGYKSILAMGYFLFGISGGALIGWIIAAVVSALPIIFIVVLFTLDWIFSFFDRKKVPEITHKYWTGPDGTVYHERMSKKWDNPVVTSYKPQQKPLMRNDSIPYPESYPGHQF